MKAFEVEKSNLWRLYNSEEGLKTRKPRGDYAVFDKILQSADSLNSMSERIEYDTDNLAHDALEHGEARRIAAEEQYRMWNMGCYFVYILGAAVSGAGLLLGIETKGSE